MAEPIPLGHTDELLDRVKRRSRAMRRRRLAWRWGATAAALAALAALGTAVLPGSSRSTGPPPGPVATAPAVVPERPTALAVARTGGLYIADPARQQILERLADGRFVVVAGTGRAGFSGDRGPALDAELDDPAGMAVGPDGTLYFADQANGRVRAVSPAGTISTVAGGGTGAQGWVPAGTPARQADLNPTDVALGPGGRLYIASGDQVLRLEADGTLTPVMGASAPSAGSELDQVGEPAVDASADGADGIAFDSAGDLYVFGFDEKTLLVVSPAGTLVLAEPDALYPRDNGGLATTPDGSVLAMDELGLDRLSPSGLQPLLSFQAPFLGIHGFSPDGIAVGPDGTIYLDTFYGNGFTDRSAIVATAGTAASSRLLWEAAPG